MRRRALRRLPPPPALRARRLQILQHLQHLQRRALPRSLLWTSSSRPVEHKSREERFQTAPETLEKGRRLPTEPETLEKFLPETLEERFPTEPTAPDM